MADASGTFRHAIEQCVALPAARTLASATFISIVYRNNP